MDDFDIKCLPTDFVGISRPSKVIEALYKKKEKEETKAIENMNIKKQKICDNYKQIFEDHSQELKRQLHEIRGFIKNELYDSKIKTNYDNANSIQKHEFKQIYKRIQDYTRQQHDLVENFYLNLIRMEKDKSKEFTKVLKGTYEEIKRVSLKLPSEYDAVIEHKIMKINQTILCNNRNYLELKTQLQAEIQNNTKDAIQELQYIKDRWVKFIRNQTEKALDNLKSQYFPDFTKLVQTFKRKSEQLGANLMDVKSITTLPVSNDWLNDIRQTLASLDHKAKKIMMNYKQAAALVYHRFFQELKGIEEALTEMINAEQIPKEQAKMYTPSLQEISQKYEVELETIQTIWNDLVEYLSKTVDNTYEFLLAGAKLWQKHFKRTEVLQIIILKDLENVVKQNNISSEPYETKLNIFIDTLRQEPTKDRLKKTLDDIKKLLVAMEDLYRSQYQSEVASVKKYKSTHDLRVDVLLAELKRFLAVYPPNMDKDPKIQRKRGSQTSEIADPTDGLIPNQMMFCKYQIEAISNWQFGLWESIGNYVVVARTEIMAETEKWIQTNFSRLDRRLEVRLGIHAMRLETIQAYIYDERLEELCVHRGRFEEHQNAVERRLIAIKDNYKFYQDMYDTIVKDYKNEIDVMEMKSLESENSYFVASYNLMLNAKEAKCLEDMNNLMSEYLEKCDTFANGVKASHIALVENIKLFSESGNFSITETKEVMRDIEKLEAQIDKAMTAIKNQVDLDMEVQSETVHTGTNQIGNTLMSVIKEHTFGENLNKKLKNLKKDLIKEVCASHCLFKTVTDQFEQSKADIDTNCGNYSYFKAFADQIRDMVQKLNDMANYLDEPDPARFYSDKSATEMAVESKHSGTTVRKRTEDQRVQEITRRLFNFEIVQGKHTFFMKLNQILRKYWDDILVYSNAFYIEHHRCFFLDDDKIHKSHLNQMNDLYKKFLYMQNQCETRWMQDTKEYVYFASNYLIFVQNYIETYMDEYARKTLKHFEQFFEKEVKQVLQANKVNIRKQYEELGKKLKPLHGHPRNKRLLEQLQIQAEIIHSDAKENCQDIKAPHLKNLEQQFSKAFNDYMALKDLIPEITEAIRLILSEIQPGAFLNWPPATTKTSALTNPHSIKLHQLTESLIIVIENLNKKLNKKVYLLRMIVDDCSLEDTKVHNPIIISHCKSFLTCYDLKSQSLPQLGGNVAENSIEYPSWQENNSSGEDSSSSNSIPSSTSIKTPLSTMSFASEELDFFLTDLREYYSKYRLEVEGENFEDILEILKNEWQCAINRVLNLYRVKYY